jgi:hypothetical protein
MEEADSFIDNRKPESDKSIYTACDDTVEEQLVEHLFFLAFCYFLFEIFLHFIQKAGIESLGFGRESLNRRPANIKILVSDNVSKFNPGREFIRSVHSQVLNKRNGLYNFLVVVGLPDFFQAQNKFGYVDG